MEFNPLPFQVLLFIETAASRSSRPRGSGAWTAGVNFSRLMARSPYRGQVQALYQRCGD